MKGEYWDMYGVGDAWVNRYGDQVDPTTFPDEDSLRAAGWYHVDQRGGSAWVERNIGDVPHDRIIGLTCHDNPLTWAAPNDTPYLGIPVESLGRDQ